MITATDLLPYLPVSLEMITEILTESAKESVAITDSFLKNIRHFIFELPPSAQRDESSLRVTQCVQCDATIHIGHDTILCQKCTNTFTEALRKEAESNGWPALAVYEHEICYLAASCTSPVSTEKLASRSRLTVRRMRQKLTAMKSAGFLSDMDGKYIFPPLRYPRESYRRNAQFIRTLPASLTEDVEARVVHILVAVGVLFLLMIIMAICAIPFPLILLIFLISAPIMALTIWMHRSKIDAKEIE